MGMHSQDTAELFFNDCRIPKANMLGMKGGGFMMLMEKLQQERLCTAAGSILSCELMVAEMMKYVKEIKNGEKPISKQQSIQFALMEMWIETRMTRTFVDTLIADHIAGKQVVVEIFQ